MKKIMQGKKLMLALVMATIIALPLMTASAAGLVDLDTTVKVTDASFECGQTGTSQIQVSIANDPGVHGVEVHLSFDHTKLRVVDADDSLDGVQIAPADGLFPLAEQVVVQKVDNAAGTILFAVSRKDGDSVQNANNVAIATITWEAVVDCATVTEENCSEVGVTNALMSDADGYAITVNTMLPGTVCYDGEKQGCIIGSVHLQGRNDHSGVTVTAEKGEDIVASATTDATGYFKLEQLPPDTYEVYARMYGYLDALKGSGVPVVDGDQCMDLGATKLLGGDVAPQPEPDNEIDIGDITYIAYRFRSSDLPDYLTADVNDDGVVNILDLTMAAANFERTGPTPWSMTP